MPSWALRTRKCSVLAPQRYTGWALSAASRWQGRTVWIQDQLVKLVLGLQSVGILPEEKRCSHSYFALHPSSPSVHTNGIACRALPTN